jgi:putative hydrolase of the HAD superfamily
VSESAVRAVIFDLFDTLVDYDPEGARAFQNRVADRLGRDPDEFALLWREGRAQRDSAPLRDYLRELGAPDASVEELVGLRLESTRSMLAPRPGAIETLAELRRRGYLVGLITVCSDDVTELWAETAFAGLFDATVLSCAVGMRKPDPRIYRLACEELDIAPEEAIFVGDGANDELAGAERVGMRAVLVHRAGEEPQWDEVRDWRGPRITAIPQVLSHLEG